MARHGTRQLRIIGGKWRGHRLRFASVAGLRPTGDRNRETLFNWLQPVLPGARCLDLFAGSGALGLEAASRGAGRVTLVERTRQAASMLRENVRLLAADTVDVVNMDARRYLSGPPTPLDIVFLDPPFGSGLLADACSRLEDGGWLAPGARVYLEADRSEGLPPMPTGWTLLRQKESGQVLYGLASKESK